MDFLIEKRCDLWITLRQSFPGKCGSLCTCRCRGGRTGGIRCRLRIRTRVGGVWLYGFRLFQRGCPEKRHRFRQKEIFRGNPAVAPAGCVTLPGITDDDETVDIVEIPAGVADIGVGNLELTVHITLFPGGIAEKQTVQCAGTGDKCVGAEDGDERAGGKSHVKFQTALVIPDLNADKSAVFPLFLTVVFVKVRDKTFVCRQNGHFLFGVFYGSICKEETRYDDRKAEE